MADSKQRPARGSADDATLRARGIYLLPNLFTSAALFAGFYAIVQAMKSNFELSAIIVTMAFLGSLVISAIKCSLGANDQDSLIEGPCWYHSRRIQ